MAEWERGKNPLLNELVIDNISKYLSFEELKVCRGLNHLWKKTNNKLILKRCRPIRLVNSTYSYPSAALSHHMTISQFMEIYSYPSHSHPLAEIIRQYRNFDVYWLGGDCMIFYDFMTQVGPQMTSLKFVNVQVFRNSQDLVDIVSSKYTPKLEELEICILENLDNYQQSDFQTVLIEAKENKHLRRLSLSHLKNNKIPWLDVLSLYPNLKVLCSDNSPAGALEDIANALVTIRKANETKLKLTELKFFCSWASRLTKPNLQRIWDLLKTANLPLEKISLDDSVSEISLKIIEHYRISLKSLELEGHYPKPFPLMEALERISVNHRVILTQGFLTKVPNLKSLCFKGWLHASFPKSTPNPLLSLTTLHTGEWKGWNVTQLEKLLLWMPNVQNLGMMLNNTTFSWICKYFPNLKELTVRGGELEDSGVVGEFDEAFEVEGCRVNITNLKALEKFEMPDDPSFNKKGLTEKSVFYGFSLMPKLSKLTLRVKLEFSADAMLALNRDIKHVRVHAQRIYKLKD